MAGVACCASRSAKRAAGSPRRAMGDAVGGGAQQSSLQLSALSIGCRSIAAPAVEMRGKYELR